MEFFKNKSKVAPLSAALIAGAAAGTIASFAKNELVHPKEAEKPIPAVSTLSAETPMPTAIHSSDAAPKASDFKVDTAAALNRKTNDLDYRGN